MVYQVTGRTWRGSAFGGVKGRTEIPGLVEGLASYYSSVFIFQTSSLDYLQGKVKIDEYITHNKKFADINGGFADMHVSQPRTMLLILLICSDRRETAFVA